MEIISLANATEDGTAVLNLTIEDDGGDIRSFQVPKTSSRYARTLELATRAMTTDDEDERERAFDGIAAMHDISRQIAQALETLDSDTRGSFMLSRAGVLYEGTLLPKTISTHIVRILHDNSGASSFDRWSAFAKFVEKLYSNVDGFIRDQLFDWLVALEDVSGGFTLTKNGNLIGYKGTGLKDGVPTSGFSGHAFVLSRDVEGNEVTSEYKGQQIPNAVGTEVMMPRNEVQFDPAVGCAAGLHVSNIDYARGYASGCILMVEVDPRDIVSVPTQHSAQKMRVSRYKVLQLVEESYSSTFYDTGDDDLYEDIETEKVEGWDDDEDADEERDYSDSDDYGWRY